MEKYNFSTKLYEACDTDPVRPTFMCVHFISGFAYASNGCIAVKQSMEYHSVIDDHFLEGKSIHKESFKQIMTFQFATCNEDGIECKDSDGRSAFFEYFDCKGDMPDFEKNFQKTSLKSLTFIGFDPEQFHKLSKALYAPNGNIRVQFQGVDRAMLVDVIGIENQEAIIMPVILNDSLF